MSFAPSGSSTRMPQTKRAARTLRVWRAFKMLELASCQRRLRSSFSRGSSIVSASWGCWPFHGFCCAGFCGNFQNELAAPPRNVAQDAAEAAFKVDDRNLRRFMDAPQKKEFNQLRA